MCGSPTVSTAWPLPIRTSIHAGVRNELQHTPIPMTSPPQQQPITQEPFFPRGERKKPPKHERKELRTTTHASPEDSSCIVPTFAQIASTPFAFSSTIVSAALAFPRLPMRFALARATCWLAVTDSESMHTWRLCLSPVRHASCLATFQQSRPLRFILSPVPTKTAMPSAGVVESLSISNHPCGCTGPTSRYELWLRDHIRFVSFRKQVLRICIPV